MSRTRRVLLVADAGPAPTRLAELVVEQGCAVHPASLADALRHAGDEWDAVLIDAGLAHDDGHRISRALRSRLGPHVPIILVTPLGDVAARRLGLQNGADDFIVTPPTSLEVGVRLGQAMRLGDLGRELEAARAALAFAQVSDPTTGLYSVRALSDRLAAEHARARRYRRPLAVLMIGVEPLRRSSAEAIDRLLAMVGQGLRAALRETDFLARAGDDELAVIAPETGVAAGRTLAARLLGRGRDLGRDGDARVAIGMATVEDRLVATTEDLLDRARAALARARGRGGEVTPNPD